MSITDRGASFLCLIISEWIHYRKYMFNNYSEEKMKTLIMGIVIALIFIPTNEIKSQTSNEYSPGLNFGVGGGISGFSYGTSNYSYNAAYHIGAKLKLNIPESAFTPVAYLNYYFLTGTFSGTPLNTTVPVNTNINQKILSLGAGAEFKLAQGAFSPYLAVDVGFNNIGEISYDQSPLNLNNTPSISRTGMDFGGGVAIKIPYVFTIDASLKYAFLNMFGKAANEPQMNAVVFSLMLLF